MSRVRAGRVTGRCAGHPTDVGDSTYTDPELRERVKAEVLAGDKGGRPGQWSARKAQLVAAEYKRQGGGYTTDKEHEGEAARHLDRWTDEEWQTKDGSARARDGDETARYLPKQAWEQLSDAEKEQTDAVKRQGTRSGDQFVANPEPAKKAGQATREPLPSYDDLTVAEVVQRLRDLDDGGRERVRLYEQAHKARKGVLGRL